LAVFSKSTVEQELAVPFPAKDWGFDGVGVGATQSEQHLANFVDRRRLNCGIAHDAPLAHLLAAGFELRLYQHYDLPVSVHGRKFRESCCDYRRQNQSGGDKRNVHDYEVDGFAHLFHCEIAGVGFFVQAHSRVLTQPEINLAVAGVDCNYTGCAALQKAIRESAG
jgi:hypothetical protein